LEGPYEFSTVAEGIHLVAIVALFDEVMIELKRLVEDRCERARGEVGNQGYREIV
jgi:hypothetical protein